MLVALLLGLLLGFLGSVPIAGPVAAMVFERAVKGRQKEARAIAIGSAIAECLYSLMAFWGLTTVLHRFPKLLPVSHVLSAVLFAALGFYFLLRKPHHDEIRETKEKDETKAHGGKWLLGFSVSALNPTLLVTWTGVITALHGTGLLRSDPIDALPFAGGVGAGIIVWFLVLLALVHRFRKKLKPESLDGVVRVMGAAFVVAGLVLGVRLLIRGL
jgi:threonine/homoserine/homoserine lactone efflux protein